MEHVFDRILKKHSSQEEGNVYIVLDYQAPHNYTNLLFFTFVCVIVNAIAHFWDDFLFEESYDCSTKSFICCYRPNQISSSHLDCSNINYLNNNNITSVICYRFVFRLGTATGSALGIVGTIAMTIFAITWCILKISKGSRATQCRAMLTLFFQVTTTLIVLAATMLLFLSKMIVNFNTISLFKGYPITILIIVYIVSFPWKAFKKNDWDESVH